MWKARLLSPLALAIGLGALLAAPAAAQGGLTVRVGLAVGSGAPTVATFAPAPGQNLIVAAGGETVSVPDAIFAAPAAVYLELGTFPTASAAAIATSVPTVTVPLPTGAFLLLAGPYPSEAAALSAAERAGLAAASNPVYVGAYGVRLGLDLPSLAAADAQAATLVSQGVLALPLAVGGGFDVLAGLEGDPTGQAALLARLAPTNPSATAYTPSGGEILVGDAQSVGFITPASGFHVTGGGTPGLVGYAGTLYRGTMTVVPAQGRLTVVNTLPLEDYLYGVVPREVPSAWPAQALMAQAVVSRTYALYQVAHAAGQPYDVVATTASQVYGGYSAETAATDAAVDATAGQVLLYGGQPIDALFSADSGGATENSENVFSAALPYLRGVKEATGYTPHDVWTRSVAATAVATKLSTVVPGFGLLLRITPAGRDRTFSGRWLTLTYQGTGGTYVAQKDAIRYLLNLPSTLFTLTTDADVAVAGAGGTTVIQGVAGLYAEGADGTATLPAFQRLTVSGAGGTVTVPSTPTVYTFAGRGDGHGVGFSQWGAYDMANEGYSWRDIVLHYYTGVTIGSDGTGS